MLSARRESQGCSLFARYTPSCAVFLSSLVVFRGAWTRGQPIQCISVRVCLLFLERFIRSEGSRACFLQRERHRVTKLNLHSAILHAHGIPRFIPVRSHLLEIVKTNIGRTFPFVGGLKSLKSSFCCGKTNVTQQRDRIASKCD